jgi:hypothetical protein
LLDRKTPCSRYTLALGLAAISLLWFLGLTYFTISLSSHLITVKNAINPGDIFSSDFRVIGNQLPKIDRDIKVLNRVAWPVVPFIKVLSIVPGMGPYADQILPVYSYLSTIVQAGNVSYPHLVQLLDISEKHLPVSELVQQLFVVASNGKGDFKVTADMLDEAEAMRKDIDPVLLPIELIAIFESLDQHTNTVIQGFHLLAVLPDMLGSLDAPVNYLLLAQNRDELRASGGFITGIGSLQIAAGELISLDISDSYSIDDFSKGYPPPPDPIRKFMLAGYWVPRDGNWNPDFPTSAQITQGLYELSTGHATQGVIAFDQDALISLIRLVAPIGMPEFSEPLTSTNIEILMHQARAPSSSEVSGENWLAHRKDFMVPIGETILTSLMQINDRQTLFQLGTEILKAVKTGHILLYFNQPEAQWALTRAGLDNSLKSNDHDFLLLVDSNIGFNKADAVVERSLTYLVDLSTPEVIPAMLIVRYTHTLQDEISCVFDPDPGNFQYSDTQKRCYLDYWRVYTHQGTRVYSANQTPIPGEWLLNGEDWAGEININSESLHHQEIAGLFMLPTSQSQDIVLQLLHPPQWLKQTQDGLLNYNFRIQKQAGLSELPFVLQINPPPGYQLVNPGTEWRNDADTGFWVWEGQIIEPRHFELYFAPSSATPP